MRTSKTLTTMLTTLAFLSNGAGGVPIVQAQAGPAAGVPSGGFQVPNSTPTALNLSLPLANVQRNIAACQATALGDNKAIKDGLSNIGDILSKSKGKSKVPDIAKATLDKASGLGKDCYAVNTDKGETFGCANTCAEPPSNLLKAPTCKKYYDEKQEPVSSLLGGPKNHTNYNPDLAKQKQFDTDEAKLSTYQAFLLFKSACPSEDANALNKKRDAYNCAVSALEAASGEASAKLQEVLRQNAAQYGQMVQFQQEVGDQVRQIDDILGPDKEVGSAGGGQFQGLLGMQRELNQNMPKMIKAETDFKNASEQAKKDNTTNEQTLETDRMLQVVNCMDGDRNVGGAGGGQALTCFKPKTKTSSDSSGKPIQSNVTDAAGNIVYSKQPCGSMEFLRSQVEQSAYITTRGVIRSQARTERAEQNAATFNKIVEAMKGDMSEAGKSTSWSEMSAKYASSMSSLTSQTGVNIQAQLGAVAGNCYHAGDKWRQQQMRLAKSDYATKKKEISDKKSQLAAELNSGLGDLNKSYGEAIAVLGTQAVAIDRTSCTTTDTDKMQKCYSDMRKQVNDLLEGNGNSSTSKPFSGGALVAGFAVPCKGINGCVTALQNVRKAKKEQNASAQKAKIDFANKGNTAIQAQLSGFAQYLKGAQQSVAAQFAELKQMLQSKNVKAPGNLKFMEAEQLEASETADKAPGPFKTPKNMSGVLSGMVQPNGLLNFQDTGIDGLMDAAIEKTKADAESAKEKATKYADLIEKFDDLKKKCTEDNVPLIPSDVTNNATAGLNCQVFRNALGQTDPSKYVTIQKDVFQVLAQLAGQSTDTEANAAVSAKANASNPIEQRLLDCKLASKTKSGNLTAYSGEPGSSTAVRAGSMAP